MTVRKLRWLALLSFLGGLGFAFKQPLLYVFFGFSVFSVFWCDVDERAEANLGRAAAFAYLATLLTIVACFLTLIAPLKARDAGEIIAVLALSLAAICGVHVISFVGSYLYFDQRGA